MNAYERRNNALIEKRRESRKANQEIRMIEADALMRRYELAYFDYYGRRVKLKYSNGWYTVHHRKVREDRLLVMIKNLEVLIHKQESVNDL